MLRVYEYVLTVTLAFLWIWVFVNFRNRKKMSSKIISFEKYLELMIKQYGRSGNICEAIDEAGNLSDRYMRRECGRILDALDGGEHSDASVHYIRSIKESFIKEFYSLCSSVRSFGDTLYMGMSLFDRNLKYIKEEVRLEILMREKEDFLFSGLMPLVFIPFFLLIPIEKWACGISADMNGYYSGSFGLIAVSASFAVTLLTVWIVSFLKDPGIIRGNRNAISDMILKIPLVEKLADFHIGRHYTHYLRKNEELKKLRGFGNVKEFLVRQILFMTGGFLLSVTLCFAAFSYEKNESLRKVEINEYRVYNMDEAQKQALSERLTEYFMMLKDEGVRDLDTISEIVQISKDASLQSACEAVIKERLDEYDKVGFKPGYLLIIVFSTVVGFYAPHIMLLLMNWQNELTKQRETLQLQTLILILMHHERMTVEEILRWMKYFAGVFVIAFERAVDDYSFRRREALRNLKSEVAYEPLMRIVDCLIACDDITVENAFSDLENERDYNLEQYRQTGFDSLKERAAFARIVAFLPFVTVMALHLIIPFVLTGLSQLSGYSAMLR